MATSIVEELFKKTLSYSLGNSDFDFPLSMISGLRILSKLDNKLKGFPSSLVPKQLKKTRYIYKLSVLKGIKAVYASDENNCKFTSAGSLFRLFQIDILERFLIDRHKVIAYVSPRFARRKHMHLTSFDCFSADCFWFSLHDSQLKTALRPRLARLFHPIQSRRKTNRPWFRSVFPRFLSDTYICLAF